MCSVVNRYAFIVSYSSNPLIKSLACVFTQQVQFLLYICEREVSSQIIQEALISKVNKIYSTVNCFLSNYCVLFCFCVEEFLFVGGNIQVVFTL